MFPSGTVVLARLRKGTDSKGKEGYFMEGFAEVIKFSESGRPVEFGCSLSNKYLGRWEPPVSDEVIYEERTEEVKEIR